MPPTDENIRALRVEIEAIAAKLFEAKRKAMPGEVIANMTLAYRHLEDASMRLDKAQQALDGGVSVYDQPSVIGAP